MKTTFGSILCASAFVVLAVSPRVSADTRVPSLERGYQLMYALDFDEAESEFVEWQRLHPGNALATASRAANLLFREFNRLGVLQARLFEDNGIFESSSRLLPDGAVAARLRGLLAETEAEAGTRLTRQPRDTDALFAMTLVHGLRADYASLIEQRNLAALSSTRQATAWATKLLSVAPDYFDAYLATGISSYLVGSLPLPLKWVLRVAGYRGDKARGVRELTLVAERGRLLAPFARILLAVAALRDRDVPRARALLAGLARDFPSNPLFERELRRLDGRGGIE